LAAGGDRDVNALGGAVAVDGPGGSSNGVAASGAPGSGGRPPRPPGANELAGRPPRAAHTSRNWLPASRKVSGRTTKLPVISAFGIPDHRLAQIIGTIHAIRAGALVSKGLVIPLRSPMPPPAGRSLWSFQITPMIIHGISLPFQGPDRLILDGLTDVAHRPTQCATRIGRFVSLRSMSCVTPPSTSSRTRLWP
jgi:hypothetical protein